DADAAPQHLAADLAQQAQVLGPLQRVAQVLPVRRELDAHLLALYADAARAVYRRGEQGLAAFFESALDAAYGVARLFFGARDFGRGRSSRARELGSDRGPRAARIRVRGDERDRQADSIFGRGSRRVAERERRVGRARGSVARERRGAAGERRR